MSLTNINSTLKNVTDNLSQVISATNKLGTTLGSTITGIRSSVTTANLNIAALSSAITTINSEISLITTPVGWTPTDQSGAALVFTSATGFYQTVGQLVLVWGTVTYPVTANASTATLSLPVGVPNQNYAQGGGTFNAVAAGNNGVAQPVKNTSTVIFAGGSLKNSGVSGSDLNFMLSYPTS